MPSKAATVEAYLSDLPQGVKEGFEKLRNIIKDHIPSGFEETISYGMIGYVVPNSIYPSGYHCDPKLPLPFLSIASQKNFIAIYHMGIYADPALLQWFIDAYAEFSAKKPDMGKSCIRFKKPNDIPYHIIQELVTKITPQQWIATYEKVLKR